MTVAIAIATCHAHANPTDDEMLSAERRTAAPINCGYQMGELGRRLAGARLTTTAEGAPGVITFANDGRFDVVSVPSHYKLEPVHSQSVPAAKHSAKQKSFNFDGLRVPLATGEEITAVAFANTPDGGRVMVGTSDGNIIIISTSPGDFGKVITGPFEASANGKGPVHGIDVVDDTAFIIRRGNRATARLAADGAFMENYQRDAAHADRTHDGNVTGFEFADLRPNPARASDRQLRYRQVTVTVGADGIGRVNFLDDDGVPRLRLLTPNGDGNPGPAISHVSVSPTEKVRLFATADATGAVRIFNRHLGLDQPLRMNQSDAKPPVVIQRDSHPVRAMQFVPYASTVPKLFVVSGDGRVAIHKFDMSSSRVKRHDLQVDSPVTQALWLSNDLLLVGTESGQVQKWDLSQVESPKLLATYSGHQAPIDSIEVIQGGSTFVSTSTDGSIRAAPLNIGTATVRIVPVIQP